MFKFWSFMKPSACYSWAGWVFNDCKGWFIFYCLAVWSRVSAAQWHGGVAPHYFPHCSSPCMGPSCYLISPHCYFVRLHFTVRAYICVCALLGMCAFCFPLHVSVVWLRTCAIGLISLPCRRPEHSRATTSILSSCPKARSSPPRGTPLVQGSSTQDSPPLWLTTANSGLAPSRPNRQCSGRHGTTSRLSSQGPSLLFITTTGIRKARWARKQTAATSLGFLSLCQWPDYRRATITMRSNRRVWERRLDLTQHCCSPITRMARWRHRRPERRMSCPRREGSWA